MSLGTEENPLRVAIVGSGPAGFYAAGQLLGKKAQHVADVDVFDRLPTPWGLVRAGVAPDHPNIKAVSRMYEKTAGHERFRFFGNVEIGRDLTSAELRRHYHAVIYAIGAQSDRRMGIPGEDLPGSWAATDFVAWYNAHPDHHHLEFDLGSSERAVVIGNGNVAIDCARMLALTHDELAATDVADHALEALRDSGVREIVILGRRGPVQAAFTNPELLELGEMVDADVLVDPGDIALDPVSQAFLEDVADITHRKNVEILSKYAQREPSEKGRRIVLRFLRSPVEIVGDERVEGIVVERNELVSDDDGNLRARPTGERETIECGLVLRSIGYRGVELPGVPFDERRAVIPNDGGRVIDPESGEPRSGEYVTGWIKRGPSGVIGTNKKDAAETVAMLVADLGAGALPAPEVADLEAIDELLRERGVDPVTQAGWEAIDRHERETGEPHGRPRVKLAHLEKLLDRARGGAGVSS